MENNLTTGFADGNFVPINEIKFPVDSIAINRGYGAFDFFGVKNGYPFFLDRHLDRFINTMRLLKIKIRYAKEDIYTIITDLIQRNDGINFYIKLFALPVYQPKEDFFEGSFYAIPVMVDEMSLESFTNGVTVITKEYIRFMPEAKSTNYLPVFSWHSEILKNKAIDVLYHTNDYITETSRGNIFIVKNKELFTPGRKMLRGITRSVVMDIAEKSGISCFEMDLTIEDLRNADEVFLSSTTKKILPVVKVDDYLIGSAKHYPVTNFIMQEFFTIERNWPSQP